MWRSLFYSIGIGLFALGLQALVVEHVTVSKNTKIQKLLKKVFSDDKPGFASNQGIPGQFNVPNVNQVASGFPPQSQVSPNNQSFGVNTGSRFGPSRFSGPAYGTGYGGSRINASQVGNSSQFGSTQFGSTPQFQNRTNAQLAGFRGSPTVGSAGINQPPIQQIFVREWMPWSLLASGAIIFLYTHTHHRRRFDD